MRLALGVGSTCRTRLIERSSALLAMMGGTIVRVRRIARVYRCLGGS